MNNDFIKSLKEVFENPEKMDSEQIRKLIGETNQYFASLEEIVKVGDEEEQNRAMDAAVEIKQLLESKIHQFSPFIGAEQTDEDREILAEVNKEPSISRKTKRTNKLKPIKMS